jgi:hypothetical protein
MEKLIQSLFLINKKKTTKIKMEEMKHKKMNQSIKQSKTKTTKQKIIYSSEFHAAFIIQVGST